MSPFIFKIFTFRNDDKFASEYNIEGGSVLHLVLALRGGGWKGRRIFIN
jgi:hypothetical protein